MATSQVDVLVVGAGIAGVSAAVALQASGHSVRVTERTAEVGGRMAASTLEGVRFDHGAQFFTTRSETFSSVVADAVAAGAVTQWTNGFDNPPDGFPRWRGAPDMTSFVAWLAESADLEIQLEHEVTDLRSSGGRAVILTAPVPESLALLTSNGLLPDPATHQQLAALHYKPTISLTMVLDQPPGAMPDHGGVQFLDDASLAFVTDNQRKGVASAPAVTVHLSNDLSYQLWDRDDAHIVAHAGDLIRTHLDGAAVTSSRVTRWRYAGPVTPWPERVVLWGRDPLVALAGEVFGGPKVEGAYLSGLAAAESVAAALAAS